MEPVIVPTIVAVDLTIDAPTVGTPSFNEGVLGLIAVFDTDGGVTKTYVAGDVMTIPVAPAVLSIANGVTPAVKTYNVV
jgi:hypothetical protein